jgi:division protein CdvB (Snf7/Vps24/ESCRT-III family)
VSVRLGENAILVKKFLDRWKDKESEQPSLSSKIKSIVKPSENVKDQINLVIQRLDVQTKKLDIAVKRFENRDAAVFQCVVKALSDRDKARANILASELWEIRKVEKMLMQESLALESVSMRLSTVSEIGDLVTVLAPAASVLKNIRSGMSTVLPEAGQELESIGSLLTDIVVSTNQSTEMQVNTGTVNEEAEKILAEAELAAENRLKEQIPEAATGIAMNKKTSIEA